MKRISRRQFFRLSGATAAGAFLAACGEAPLQSSVTLRWWDHFSPLKPLHEEIFAAYEAEHPSVTITHELYNLPELGQSLQLAFNSKQAPDVHAIASLNVPASRLVAEGWFTPLDGHVSAEFQQRFPAGLLLEGLHIFGGKLYSFPLFGFRSHPALLWFNKELMANSGLDPVTGPKTWDEFRQAAKAVTQSGGGQVFGWIQAIQLAERLGDQVTVLARTASGSTGFTSSEGALGGIDWETGEYVYHTDPFLQAIEFLVSLQADGSLLPGSTSLDARNARARFTTGVAAMNFDGPWNMGVINNDYKPFLDKIAVASVPVPNASQPAIINRGPLGGDFWISSQSQHPEIASALLEQFNTENYYVKLAERMDQPPLDLRAVEKAEVHPAYKQALAIFDETIRLAPSPIVKNPAIAQVLAEMTDIRPNLGEIVQGVFGGTMTDYRAALKDYSDKLTAERERALKTVQETGAQVSIDDFIFSNWDPTRDYTAESYN